MAKPPTQAEEQMLLEIMRSIGLNRNTGFHINRNFMCSVGRIALKFWRQQDAIDPDWIFDETPDGEREPIAISGFDSGKINQNLKAYQRADYYVVKHGDALRHIVDWFSVAGRENHGWLHNVDELGRPKKLMKIGSIEALKKEADEQFRRIRHRRHQERMEYAHQYARNNPSAPVEPPTLTDEDVRFEATMTNGLTLVRLLTPAALDDESDRMSHCVGYGSYDRKLADPAYEYYSVRDAADVSMATLEIKHGVMLQFYGRGNVDPDTDVAVAVGNIMNDRGWEHWVTVYKEYAQRYQEYYDLCKNLRMPFHFGALERFHLLTEDKQAAEIARLRKFVDEAEAPAQSGFRP